MLASTSSTPSVSSFKITNYLVARIDPWFAQATMQALETARKDPAIDHALGKLWNSIFLGVAAMWNKNTASHRDHNSDKYGVDVLAIFGKFGGGQLVLEELGVEAEYGARTIVILRGGLLKHGIKDFYGGNRLCLAFFAHRFALAKLGATIPKPHKIVKVDVNKASDAVFDRDLLREYTHVADKACGSPHVSFLRCTLGN